MIGGVGVGGSGPLHRAPAGAKVLALLAVTVTAFAASALAVLGALGAVVVLGYVAARPPRAVLGRFVRLVAAIALVLFAVQWWFLGLDRALVVAARFVVTVAAAHLLTLTTTVDELVALVERLAAPLRRVGVPVERLGLLVGLTVAAVATLTRVAGEVAEAARARGLDRSVTARTVPLVVRAVRHADALGEALAARGIGDE